MKVSELDDKELYTTGHALALAGHYGSALDTLNAIRDKHDAMVLTMIGYSTRKLGHTAEGIAIYQEALAIDGHLLLVSRLRGPERQKLLVQLDGQVRQVEHLAGRVAMLGVQAAAPILRTDGPSPIEEIESHVALLEQSRRELLELDRQNGLDHAQRLVEEQPIEVTGSPITRS